MNAPVGTAELEGLARRSIWWKSPEESLRYPDRLLAQIMAKGTWDDVQLAKQYWSRADFVSVLRQAPPGVFDPRSWTYWHYVLQVEPVAPLPERRLP